MNVSQSATTPSLSLILILITLQQTFESTLFVSGCACPGDTLTYECTVVGAGFTIWTGSAFNCSNSNHEILLLHNRFSSTKGDYGSCNNRAIVGRSLSAEGNNYTSQLNVTITPDTAGKTIECLHDDGLIATLVFTSQIPITGPFSPPSGLKFNNIDYSSRELTFSWSSVTPDCPAIHYNILASNCGSCPTTTNHTNVTCTDDVPSNDSICTFAVQTVVCGNIIGNVSDPLHITFYTTESIVRTPTDSLRSTENQGTHTSSTTEMMGINNLATSQVYIISFSCLATVLFVGVVVAFLIVIVIFLKRSKAKIRAASVQSNIAIETTHNELAYENVMLSPSPSDSAINTQDNVAYGQTRISIRGVTQDIPMNQNDTGPSSRAGIVNTQDNVAYGRAKTSTRGAGATQDVIYEEVTGPLPLVSTIATQDNVAYRCTQQL